MSRARTIRVLLAASIGALIGAAWAAIDQGASVLPFACIAAVVIPAYVLAWTLRDDQ